MDGMNMMRHHPHRRPAANRRTLPNRHTGTLGPYATDLHSRDTKKVEKCLVPS